jgi:hypothetical protein
MYAPAPLLHNWHEQLPSNQGDLDLSVMGEAEKVYYTLKCVGKFQFNPYKFNTTCTLNKAQIKPSYFCKTDRTIDEKYRPL